MLRSAPACWALWIGRQQWVDLPGFEVGQEGWVQLVDVQRGLYIFSPDLSEGGTVGYRVPCSAEDFLLLAFHEPEPI